MGKTIDLRKACEPIDVNVVNQLDLSTIESLLTSIKNSVINIDANTDGIEVKLDSVISELQTNGTTNHADLLNVIAELQQIDANTDSLETQLASIISNTSTNATEATLVGLLNAFNAEDFASETTLAAIKAITDQITFTGSDLNVNASVTLPAGLATEAKQDEIIANQTDGTQLTQIVDAGGEAVTVTGGRLDVNASVTLDGESSFGDNSSTSTVALSDVSATVLSVNLNRKEAVIVNTTNKTIWIYYGTPASFGVGIPLFKDDVLIEDRYRGIITGIMNTGETGNIQVTEVTL